MLELWLMSLGPWSLVLGAVESRALGKGGGGVFKGVPPKYVYAVVTFRTPRNFRQKSLSRLTQHPEQRYRYNY